MSLCLPIMLLFIGLSIENINVPGLNFRPELLKSAKWQTFYILIAAFSVSILIFPGPDKPDMVEPA
jgi:hypothetical protein